MSKIISIDLGTSNSCLSVFENGSAVVIANAEGKRTTPSIVGFDKSGERKVGDAAKRQAVTNPTNTVYEIKRFMGNKYSECTQEIERVTYKVVDDNGVPKVLIDDKKYSPEEISAMILQKLKNSAEDYLGEEVKDCIITVPAYFDDSQRQATKNAAEIAGMSCRRIINEPTSAAIAFGVDKADKDMKIVVFDCGGGTHDVSILDFGGGVFEVLATDGDTHLGGSDIDERITNWLVEKFKGDTGIDLTLDPMAMQRLKEASEKAKIELSSSSSTDINLPYISAEGGVPKHLVETLTRAKFEQLITDIIERTIAPCETALKNANLDTKDIDEIILVGGSTRIPAIQNAVEKFFGKAPSHSVNPDEAVAMGGAIQGAILNNESGVSDIVLLDVTPLNLGIETMGNVLTTIVEANTTIPCKRTMTFSNATDMQAGATIMVYSGNRPMAYQNKSLGQFNIEITPSPKGMNQIEVSFDIDANGILTVSAVDKALNKPNKITIEASSNLSPEEIERMKAEAEANAEADKKEKEKVEKINNADSFAFTIEKSMKDLGDKISDDERKNIEESIDKVKKAVNEKNVDDCNLYMTELKSKWEPIVSRLYQSTSGATQPNGFDFTGTPFEGFTNANASPTPDSPSEDNFEEVK